MSARDLAMILLATIWIGVGSGAANAEGDAPLLRFDPFERPTPASPPRSQSEPANTPSDSAWEPVLRATMVAAGQSLANLSGVILEVGDETHGYRLAEVRKSEAIFVVNGSKRVLRFSRRGSEKP